MPESSKKQNLDLPCAKLYAENTRMKYAVAYMQTQTVCKHCTRPFYIRGLSISRSGYLQRVLEPRPLDSEGRVYSEPGIGAHALRGAGAPTELTRASEIGPLTGNSGLTDHTDKSGKVTDLGRTDGNKNF